MIEFVGSLWQHHGYPHIYFIVEGRFLYIGETQRIPVVRWGEHFSTSGSYLNALVRNDPDYEPQVRPAWITAFRCERIAQDVRQSERKLATQWVEHDLHVRACSNAAIGSAYTLISDTSRTSPLTTKYSWLGSMAREIFEKFQVELQRQRDE